MSIQPEDLKKLNKQFKDAEPQSILKWSIDNLYPDLAILTSFQISGVVRLDLIRQMRKDIPVYFIDTGYHFPETLQFRDEIINKFRLNVISVKPMLSKDRFEKQYGKELYNTDPETCCSINKVEPQERIMKTSGYSNWLTGIRKDQSKSRAEMSVFMMDENGKIRVHPLINWKWDDVWKYINDNKVPYNSLYQFGYASIGCSPPACTAPGNWAHGDRSGRWVNFTKTECGLHYKLSEGNNEKE